MARDIFQYLDPVYQIDRITHWGMNVKLFV